MVSWFDDTIVKTNRLPLFCVFAGILIGFLFIRLSVRMIRAQVKWWPGNVSPGGVHIHHVVFGTIFMLVAGIAGFALPDRAYVGLCITGGLFGIGAALVLDEFALILHLQDVYWSEEGRTSVDAIFVAIAAVGLLLLGFRPLSLASDDFRNTGSIIGTSVLILYYLALIAITLLKGKVWLGLFGILLPFILLFSAVRVARPRSPWARWRYQPGKRRGPAKMERAIKRERRYRQPLIKAKDRLQNALAGAPSEPNPPEPESIAELQHEVAVLENHEVAVLENEERARQGRTSPLTGAGGSAADSPANSAPSPTANPRPGDSDRH